MSWTKLKRVEAPDTPLISIDEAKTHLRIEHVDDDDYITGLVEAATAQIEGPSGIGLALITQTWRLSLDAFPSDPLRLPLGPVQAITSITYVDENGQTQTLAPSSYVLDTDQTPAILCRAHGAAWPAAQCQSGAVKITFTAGYGDDPEDVPADLRHAAKLLTEVEYDPQAAERSGAAAQAILNRHRAFGIG